MKRLYFLLLTATILISMAIELLWKDKALCDMALADDNDMLYILQLLSSAAGILSCYFAIHNRRAKPLVRIVPLLSVALIVVLLHCLWGSTTGLYWLGLLLISYAFVWRDIKSS